MSSTFDDMAGESAGLLVSHFGERDGDGALAPHVITLPSGELVLWEAAVSELAEELLEEDGKLVGKQTCTLTGLSRDLPDPVRPFPVKTRVSVFKYGEAFDEEFNVDVTRSRYGGPLTVVGLIRKPIKKFGRETARANR
jgi:hypothetical protein